MSEKGVQLGVDSCLMENKHFSGALWNQNSFKSRIQQNSDEEDLDLTDSRSQYSVNIPFLFN